MTSTAREIPRDRLHGAGLSARDADVVRRRAAGETLREIGDSLGITRERVRQIVAAQGGPSASAVHAVRVEAQREVAARHAHIVVAGWAAGRTLRQLADELGVSVRCVQTLIESEATDEAHLARRQSKSRRIRRHSDSALVAALHRVSHHLGRTPSLKDYGQAALELDLPRGATLLRRFGGWRQACAAAGLDLPPGRRRRAASKPVPPSRPQVSDRELRQLGERFPELPRHGPRWL